VLRRKPTRLVVPFYRIYLDLIPRIVIYNSHKYVVYFLNNAIWINKVETVTDALSTMLRLLREELEEASWSIWTRSKMDPIEPYDEE